MQKKKLYLDCDGVILDTITKSYQIFKQNNIIEDSEIKKYYEKINWKEFISTAGEINNSISKIKKIMEYFDTKILTHVHSEKEGKAKTDYFNETLPGVDVVIVSKGFEKADAVESKGAILVDDFLPNLEKWEEKGGIPIKFSDSGKKCKFITITDLMQLIDINFDNKV